MDKTKRLVYITVIFCFIALILTIADFLAFTDIYHDFIGTRVLEMLNLSIGEDLPDWTATKGEWGIVQVSWVFRFLFFVLL